MRTIAFLLLGLTSLFASGCLMDPNSRFNVNRGEYHDEYDMAGKEGRGDQGIEKAPDRMGSWLYSPKARAISRNLGEED
jgi:hypothetical protein